MTASGGFMYIYICLISNNTTLQKNHKLNTQQFQLQINLQFTKQFHIIDYNGN